MKSAWILLATIILQLLGSSLVTAAATILYSPDSDHLWNQLYSTLFVRVAQNGKEYNDLMDPPFWPRTRFLLEAESRGRALSLLREFSKKPALRDEMPDLKKAMMQRDLIAVFFWLTWPHLRQEKRPPVPQERELAVALAQAIGFLALPESAIRKLPDNYPVAIEAKAAPAEFDAAKPKQAFLPPDLLNDNGPWIALGGKDIDLLAAQTHFKVFQGRSAFEVRMRIPEGRAAGEAYLRELAGMTNPVLAELPSANLRTRTCEMPYGWLNPTTPQFPTNTAWALVRRAILFATEGIPIVSPIVESVQLRVYRKLTLDDRMAQSVFEWELRRKNLFSNGGFHESQPGEDWSPHFIGKGFDPFEESNRFQSRAEPVSLTCLECHSGIGIHSVHSRTKLFELAQGPARLMPVSTADTTQMAEAAARVLPEWTLLRWLAPTQ